MTTEQWRDVVGFEGLYEVSDRGRVRSLINSRGNPRKKKRILKGTTSSDGYRTAHLHDCGLQRVSNVSALVLEAFIGPRPNGYDAHHVDNNRKNDRLKNLRWESKLDNEHHKVEHGTLYCGERHSWTRHPDSVVEEIVRLRKAGARLQLISDMSGIHISTISELAAGKRRRYLEGQS